MQKHDLISVIIPTYNRAYCLGNAIRSVLEQTYSNIELIVIDDGSTDNTENIISSIKDSRLRYIKLKKNGGPSKARNEGIKLAKGEYIAFHDSDDIWYKNKLAEQYKVMNDDPECQLVFCKYQIIKNSDKSIIPCEDSFEVDNYQYGMFEILLNENKIGTPAIVVRKNILKKVGFFNINLSTLEDWELCLRIAEKWKIKFINKILLDVYPSIDGVNQISDSRRITTFIYILSLYWPKYHNINLFKSLIARIIDDYYLLSDAEKNKTEKQLEEVIPEGSFLIKQIVYQVKEIIKRNNHIDSLDEHILFLDEQIKLRDEQISKNAWKKNILLKLFDYYNGESIINKLPERVSVYGCGEIGRVLIAVCEKEEVKVVSTIDINGKHFNNIPTISKLAEIDKDTPIIITLPDQNKVIFRELKKYCNAEILNIEELFQSK